MDFNSLKSRLKALVHQPLVSNTLWMLSTRGIGIVIQAFYFIIIARTLGVEEYGAFVGIVALTNILYHFSGLGTAILLVKNVSRDRTLLNEYWGNALLVSIVSGAGLVILCFLIALTYPATITEVPIVLFLIAIADLIFARIGEVALKALNATNLIKLMAKFGLLANFTNLLAVLALNFFFEDPGLLEWSFFYLAIRVLEALYTSWAVCHILKARPKLALFRIKSEILEGFYFSIGASSNTIYNDVDKTMLASMSSLEAAGVYGVAYRLVSIAFVPIYSLLASTYVEFFRTGKDGIKGTLKFARQIVPVAGSYGAFVSVGLIVSAPIIPFVLGDEYNNAIGAVRWLAPLVFFKSIHYFAGDILAGTGFQGFRSATQVSIALFNVLANWWLIPRYSWRGAIFSSLVSDGLLMLALWFFVFLVYRRQNSSKEQPL